MANEENYYKELPLFNNVEDTGHKAWNRLNIINNLKTADRQRDAAAYLDKLCKEDKMAIGLLLMAIKKKGLDTVRRELNRGLDNEHSSNR